MYQEIPFPKFALAALLLSVPAVILAQEDEKWAWRYTALILIVAGAANAQGLSQMSAWLSSVLPARKIGG